jgi:peptide/nickel transport system substrate-binding protein
VLSYFKFRFQRQLRRLIRDAHRAEHSMQQYYRAHLRGKWRQLAMIRGFVTMWWGLLVLLCGGLILQTVNLQQMHYAYRLLPGGVYTEGLVGTVKNVNPILPEGGASADVARLVFNGLTRVNNNGEIEADLARRWTVSPDGKTYTFFLREDIKWHDDVPFTAQDVVFTLVAIQNPDSRSPLAGTWQGVRVEAKDNHTVVYTLPKPFTPFIQATTVGILPRHLLESVDPSSLRVANFNQKPVGTGPFKLEQLDSKEGRIQLGANTGYYGKKPLVEQVILKLYPSSASALNAYARKQVMAVSRLQPGQLDKASDFGDIKLYQLTVPDQVGVFFKTTTGPLSNKTVRAALAQATNRDEIITKNLADQATALASPLMPGRLGAGKQQLSFDIVSANRMLENDGWKKNRDGIRSKNGLPLQIKLVTQANSQYSAIAETLKKQWERLGVRTTITETDPTSLQQSYIRPRKYDALLYGINVGLDPDVYAYWHSSQAADPGLNLSAYKSSSADKALEGGRTLRDKPTREAKYKSFVNAWLNDNPAVMLYSPTYIYAVSSEVRGINAHKLGEPQDRFYDIESWAVRSKRMYAE